MARKNNHTHTCYVCDKQYEYCEHCTIVEPTYNADRFCSQAHQDIFSILSKHGCKLATEEETLEALKGYDLTGLTESIKAHIESLQPKKVEVEDKAETKVKAEKAVETKKYSFRTQE